MRGKIHMVGAKNSKHPREQSVRISRFNNANSNSIEADNSPLNNSVHDFDRSKNKASDHLESLSVSGSHHQAKINEVNREAYQRKDRDFSKGSSGHGVATANSQQAGEDGGEKLNKDVQLNLQNLIQIDEKLSALSECLKKNAFANVS